MPGLATLHPANTAWSKGKWTVLLLSLTLATLLVHGYHPFSEDGGVYAAGIFLKLDSTLFVHFADFVRGPTRYSLFAAAMGMLVRLTHLPPAWVLLLADLVSIWLMLFAARQLLRRCVHGDAAQLGGVALLAAWWTLPIAGTSLVLMDPYVTARSFSTPLTLLALAFALEPWPYLPKARPVPRFIHHPAVQCVLCLIAIALVHLLMAAYALAFVVVLRACMARKRALALAALSCCAIVSALALQACAPAESHPFVVAEITRYYWFLSQWHWYELAGLAGPLAIFALLLLRPPSIWSSDAKALCRCAIFTGTLTLAIASVFARENTRVHLVARLQPLRVYLPIYALMAMLLGSAGVHAAQVAASKQSSISLRRLMHAGPVVALLVIALCMNIVQRNIYSASTHLELPWRANRNPWVEAFLWARTNTPKDALFALDAHYITSHGEDAQTFRATALRDAVPDYSKDGGEAAIAPGLTDRWYQGATAQLNLEEEDDPARLQHLHLWQPDWIVLSSTSATAFPCPYDNGAVKVCRIRLTP